MARCRSKKNKTKHWIVEDQKFFDIVTSAEDCKHSYRNQAKWFETAFYCWCDDTLSRLSMVSLSSWHSGQWRWHCRLRSGGQTVRATQQEEWRLPSQFPDECCSHGLGRLYHVTSSCFKVARLVLEGCLSQPYMNTTLIQLCSRIDFSDEMLMSVCGFCMIIFDRSGTSIHLFRRGWCQTRWRDGRHWSGMIRWNVWIDHDW